MKKLVIYITATFAFVSNPFASQLHVPKTDDDRTEEAVEPAWKTLKEEGTQAIYFQVLEENGVAILNMKVVHPDLAAVNAEQSLYLKIGKDFVKLSALEAARPCKGCGTYKVVSYRNAVGIDVKYAFSKPTAETLKKADLEKLRMMTNDGFVEFDIETKYQGALRSALTGMWN